MKSHRNRQAAPSLRSRAGFTLAELLIASGLLGGICYLAAPLLQNSFLSRARQQSRNALAEMRTAISRSLTSDPAFQNTLHYPGNATSFACLLTNPMDCTNAVVTDISILDKTNHKIPEVNDPLDPTQGFTLDGTLCHGFDPNATTGSCVFRYRATWAPICPPTGACTNPGIELKALLQVSNSDVIRKRFSAAGVNRTSFDLTYTRQELTSTSSDICSTLGGMTSGPGGTGCQISLHILCPPGLFLIGFDSGNKPNCKPLGINIHCDVGYVLQSVAADGTFTCQPGCAVQNAQNMNGGNGGDGGDGNP